MRVREIVTFVAACITIAAAVVAIRSCKPLSILPDNWGVTPEASDDAVETSPSTSESDFVKRVSSTVADWQSTGIQIQRGDILSFAASGSVTHWKGNGRIARCGPDGTGDGACSGNEPCCLAPGLGNNALVGKIGSASPFRIGSSKTVTASTSGTLYLGMNETVHCGGCADNDGVWTVRISMK